MCEAIGCLQDCRVFGGALVAVYSLPLLQWGTVDLESLTVPATSDWPGKKKLCVTAKIENYVLILLIL